jgi:hypothetical protein
MKHPAIAITLLSLVLTNALEAAPQTTWLGDAPLPIMPLQEEVATRAVHDVSTVALDPHNRTQVAQGYQTIYVPQSNVPIGWNGNVPACNAGTDSLAYQQATIDRVNFYRALSGLPGNVTLLGTTEQTDTQAAALMFSANQSLSHDPPANWLCYTNAGHTGAGNSNIALGFGNNAAAGPGAVDLYMDDGGDNNTATGHRRWVQYPPQTAMASGSIPYNPQWASNALWVFGPMGTRPSTPNGVSWPSQGYVPWQLLPMSSNRWSFSWSNANFGNATVSMTRNGVPLGVPSYESIQDGYGDNTLVWKPQGVTYAQPAQDVVYHVVVSGISGGGAPSTVAYDVIVIDPFATLPDTIFSGHFD